MRHRAGLVLQYLLGLLFLIPFHPQFITADLDPSWAFTLQYAFPNVLRFGQDIAFTYGPLGFLWGDHYFPGRFAALLIGRGILAVYLIWSLARIGGHSFHNRPRIFYWLWLWFTLICLSGSDNDGLFFGTIVITFFLIDILESENSRFRPWYLLATGVILAEISLVKFTYLALSGGLLALDAARTLVVRRRIPYATFGAILGFILIWFGLYHDLSGIFLWFRSSLEVARGYSVAIAKWGPRVDIQVFTVAVLAILGLVSFQKRHWQRLLFLIGYFLVVFKAAFVRHDAPHALIAIFSCLVVFAMVVAWRMNPDRTESCWGKARWKTALLFALPLLCMGRIYLNYTKQYSGEVSAGVLRPIENAAALLQWIYDPNHFAWEHQKSVQVIRDQFPFVLSGHGTVDLYPFQQSAVLISDFIYRPRPIFQSYSVYTSKLNQINSDFLRTNGAAETIFFSVTTIDDRYPSLDDGQSWPELLTRYQVESQTGRFLTLKRLTTPNAWNLKPLESKMLTIGQNLDLHELSSGRLLWVRLSFAPTLLKKVSDLFFKSPNFFMRVHLTSGEVIENQFVPEMAVSGFLLSPMIRSATDFAQLSNEEGRQQLRKDDVESIEFWTKDSSSYYKSNQLILNFFELELQK